MVFMGLGSYQGAPYRSDRPISSKPLRRQACCEKAANGLQCCGGFATLKLVMRRNRFVNGLIKGLRHPAFALLGAVAFACAVIPLMQGSMDVRARLNGDDDPVKIADQALDRTFNRAVAEREIRSALDAHDIDLAQSFLALATDRGVTVDPALVEKTQAASANAATLAGTAGRFVHGLWTGEPADLASLAGTAFGDLFVFGDIRDAAREGTRYLMGEKADPWIFGLAGVGLAVTAAIYVTFGAEAPVRVGLSAVKAARRTGRLNPALAARVAREAVKVENAGGLIELAGNAGRVETKAGTQAVLDGLAVAEEPQDMARLARLAAAKGGKTRAIVKLLGRAAIVLTAGAFDIAMWLFWAALTAFGFVSSCKAAAERMTQRYLDARRSRRLRDAARGLQTLQAATL
jgi:hypothetical protein